MYPILVVSDCSSRRIVRLRVGRPVILIATCNQDLAVHEQGRRVHAHPPTHRPIDSARKCRSGPEFNVPYQAGECAAPFYGMPPYRAQ